ncbi:MAG: phage/plasmid primase, P4 family [Candidatus Woesearchaeota archaeon]|jgi:putative DNA primase/helicase
MIAGKILSDAEFEALKNPEVFDAKVEIERLLEDNKIFFTKQGATYEDLISVGLAPLVYYKLKQFVESKKENGYYILEVRNPETKQEYKTEIKYEGKGKIVEEIQEIEESKEEEINFYYIDERGKTKVSISEVVKYLFNKFSFKTIYGTKGETIYFYDSGIWNKRGKEIIQTETERILNENCNCDIIKEVYEKIKRLTSISQEDFDNIPEELICLNNGILNLNTRDFIEHSPVYYFKTKIPVEYDKLKDCPEIKKFIEEMVYPEDVPVIQEWFGFMLYRRYFIKKAMILFGEKDTGKTILLNLIMKFLGKRENTSGINLQRISSGDKFALSSLKDKYANIFDDLSSKDLSDNGGFKIATGGGYITAEYKFGDSFQFMTFAKNIFATNKIPNVQEVNDDAYYDRWIPIPFDNQIEKESQDKFLLDRITTKEEMSGLLNWSLDGLKRLFDNGKFSYNKNSKEIKIIMERQNNPLVAFVQDVLVQKDGNSIEKEVMYQVYCEYCNMYKFSKMSKEQLGRNLAKYSYYIESKGGNKRVWRNVSISDTYDTLIFKGFKENKEND